MLVSSVLDSYSLKPDPSPRFFMFWCVSALPQVHYSTGVRLPNSRPRFKPGTYFKICFWKQMFCYFFLFWIRIRTRSGSGSTDTKIHQNPIRIWNTGCQPAELLDLYPSMSPWTSLHICKGCLSAVFRIRIRWNRIRVQDFLCFGVSPHFPKCTTLREYGCPMPGRDSNRGPTLRYAFENRCFVIFSSFGSGSGPDPDPDPRTQIFIRIQSGSETLDVSRLSFLIFTPHPPAFSPAM